jgi:YHS domain-containing protein/phenylpyruvate tautomerase PptA (4-oxalocrotonate tautomerase family)
MERAPNAMMFIEVFAPKGTLSYEQRRHIGERLSADLMHEESAPAAVIDAARTLVQVVFHEPDPWITGAGGLDPGGPPRYLVRLSVPGAWRKEASAELISRVTQVLADADDDPQRLYTEPVLWVQVIGVAEGSYGTLGQVMRSTDIIKMIVKPMRESAGDDVPDREPDPGTAIDPICRMTVALTDTAITLELDGTLYAFCSTGCRHVFAEERKEAMSQ